MRERSCEASAIEMGEKFRRLVRNFGDEASEMGEKFRRWVRNFNDEASKMRETEIKYIDIYIYIYILELHCSSIAKKFAIPGFTIL